MEKIIYVFSALSNINLTRYIFFIALMFFGTNLEQIILIQTIYYFINIIGEIPLGYISDRFPQKNVLIIANLISMLAMILYSIYFINNIFIIVIIAVTLDTIARTLISGTDESFYAYMFKEHHFKIDYEKYLKKINFIANICQVFGVLFLLTNQNPILLMSAFIIQAVIKLMIVIFLIKIFPKNKPKNHHQHYTVKDIKDFLSLRNIKKLFPFIFLVTALNIGTMFIPLIINETTSSLFLTLYFIIVLIATSYLSIEGKTIQVVLIFIVVNGLNFIFKVDLLVFILCNIYLICEFCYFIYYPSINKYIIDNSQGDRVSVYFSLLTNATAILSIIMITMINQYLFIMPLILSIIMIIAAIISYLAYKK